MRNTIVIPFSASMYTSLLAFALTRGDHDLAQKAVNALEAIDGPTLVYTPILLCSYGSRLAILSPWIDGNALLILPHPLRDLLGLESRVVKVEDLLERCCNNGIKLELRTRGGVHDKPEAVEQRAAILARLPRNCVDYIVLREVIHTKKLVLRTDNDLVIEVLTTANITPQEVWKIRTGDNDVWARVYRVNE